MAPPEPSRSCRTADFPKDIEGGETPARTALVRRKPAAKQARNVRNSPHSHVTRKVPGGSMGALVVMYAVLTRSVDTDSTGPQAHAPRPGRARHTHPQRHVRTHDRHTPHARSERDTVAHPRRPGTIAEECRVRGHTPRVAFVAATSGSTGRVRRQRAMRAREPPELETESGRATAAARPTPGG